MEYGVLTLKQKYQISFLSMEDIEEFVKDLIEEESKKNQKNLKKLRQGIISNINFNYNNNNINSNSMANNTRPVLNRVVIGVKAKSKLFLIMKILIKYLTLMSKSKILILIIIIIIILIIITIEKMMKMKI